jgi:hypothetical protein
MALVREYPWQERPFLLVSWWEMQRFTADVFFIIGQYLADIRRSFKAQGVGTEVTPGEFSKDGPAYKVLNAIGEHCETIGLRISKKCVDDFINLPTKGTTMGEMIERVA